MSGGLLIAGFLATTNAGRVALARDGARPGGRDLAAALAAGAVLIAAAAAAADPLLDALDISPESFRIGAGLVLAVGGAVSLIRPRRSGPFAAVLVTPELVCFAISAGAEEPLPQVLGAAGLALAVAALAALAPRPEAIGRVAPFLAALQLVVGVALVVAGVRDV
jgi:hypothetical protein